MLVGSAMRAVRQSTGPNLVEYFNETFGGTDGTVPTHWTKYASKASGAVEQRSGEFRIVYDSTGSTAGAPIALASTACPSADLEIVFTHGRTSGTGNRTSFTGLRVPGASGFSSSGAPGAATDGYFLRLQSGSTTASLAKHVGDVRTQLGTFTCPVDPWTDMGSNPCRFRISAIGDQIKCRVWRADNPEPSTWDLIVTDSAFADAGRVWSGGNGPAFTVCSHTLDNFQCNIVPLPSLTQQWTADFTGTDDAVPTGWTAQISESAPNTLAHAHIDSNELLLLADPGGSAEYASLHRAAPADDYEIVFTCGNRQTAFATYIGLRASSFSTTSGSSFGHWSSGYFVRLSSASTLRKRVSHTETEIGGFDTPVATTTAMTANPNRIRMRVRGSTILIRSWQEDDPEPTRWDSVVTDSSVTGTGSIAIYVTSASTTTGNAGGIRVDDFECWA